MGADDINRAISEAFLKKFKEENKEVSAIIKKVTIKNSRRLKVIVIF